MSSINMFYLSPYIGGYKLDKSSWPSGPWHSEPDTHYFTHQALPCAIIRSEQGHLCGYVGVEKYHPSVNSTTSNLFVHGGVTWERWGDDNGLFWIGFDCAHDGDLVLKHKDRALPGTYRDIHYVRNEVMWLAEQLAQIPQPLPLEFSE